MATKKFIIEVEEGDTICKDCPFYRAKKACLFFIEQERCTKYNFATMKIKELEEEK